MKTKLIASLILAAASSALVTNGRAQELGKDDARFRTFSKLKDGAFVYFSSNRTGGSGPVFESIDSEANTNVVHRMLFDRDASGIHFGYDLWVEPIPDSKQFRVTIKPLSDEYEQRIRNRQRGQGLQQSDRILSPVTRFPEPLTIEDGDTLRVDVMVNHSTGETIGDIIKISSKPLSPGPRAGAGRAPRDFTIEDVELKVLGSKITVNGELEGGIGGGGGCAGAIIWFYLPNRGRFIVSLTQHRGYDFQKVGTVEDNKITFSIEGNRFEWVSKSAIVSSRGNWNLWVLHDSAYQPSEIINATEPTPTAERRADLKAQYDLKSDEELDQFLKRGRCLIGAADRIEYTLKRRQE
jgi:hypothetical protein